MTKARDIASATPAPSTVSSTELGYLDGVTSAVQTQIDNKQAINAAVSTTELGYLDGVTSAIQTQLDAKVAKATLTTTGDTFYASAASTPARLGIGSTGQVLTVAGGIPSWATASSGGMTLLSTTTLSGASTTLSSIPQTYNSLYLLIYGVTANTSNNHPRCLVNGSASIATYTQFYGGTAGNVSSGPIRLSGLTTTRTDANNAFALTFNNYTSTTNYKPFNSYGSYVSGGNNEANSNMGAIVSNTEITSLVFDYGGTNTFSTGTVLLYGVK